MEDDKIRDLFRKFDPELSSDFSFINKLQHSLDAVESIKAENAELKRRSKESHRDCRRSRLRHRGVVLISPAIHRKRGARHGAHFRRRRTDVSRQLPRTGVDNNRRNSRTNGLEHLRTVLVAYEKTITVTLPSSP